MRDSRELDHASHVVEPKTAVGPVERLPLQHRDRTHVHRRLGPLEVQERLVEGAEPVVAERVGTASPPGSYARPLCCPLAYFHVLPHNEVTSVPMQTEPDRHRRSRPHGPARRGLHRRLVAASPEQRTAARSARPHVRAGAAPANDLRRAPPTPDVASSPPGSASCRARRRPPWKRSRRPDSSCGLPDPDDRRSVLVALTPDAERACDADPVRPLRRGRRSVRRPRRGGARHPPRAPRSRGRAHTGGGPMMRGGGGRMGMGRPCVASRSECPDAGAHTRDPQACAQARARLQEDGSRCSSSSSPSTRCSATSTR